MQNKKDGVAFNRRINVVDRQTGKSIYNNSDVVDMAAFSIKRCGTGAYWGKIEYAGMQLRCTNCGHLKERFLSQINGFWCYECQSKSTGLNISITEEQSNLLNKCEKSSYRSDDQTNCVSKIFAKEIYAHNRKYKFLKNGEPTPLHKILFKLTPFVNGQVELFKNLFKRIEDGK